MLVSKSTVYVYIEAFLGFKENGVEYKDEELEKFGKIL